MGSSQLRRQQLLAVSIEWKTKGFLMAQIFLSGSNWNLEMSAMSIGSTRGSFNLYFNKVHVWLSIWQAVTYYCHSSLRKWVGIIKKWLQSKSACWKWFLKALPAIFVMMRSNAHTHPSIHLPNWHQVVKDGKVLRTCLYLQIVQDVRKKRWNVKARVLSIRLFTDIFF